MEETKHCRGFEAGFQRPMFWVNVTCGVKPANGVYKPIGKRREDAYVYRNANGFELSRHKVDQIDTGWILGKAPEAYYGIPSKSLTPPQRGWKCFKGSRPGPTITYHNETEETPVKPSYRTKIYEEIIGTEEKYEQKLKTLIEVFLEPLLEEAYLPEELQTMLRLSRAIQAVAHDLLGYIQTRIRERPSLVVSSAFIKYAPQFTCYTRYCVHFMSANNKLLDLMRDDEKFRKRVTEISIANNNERLDSLLIRPVQRITKYHLFFRDLLASLDSSHPHREALQTALATVKDIAEEVNKHVYSAGKSAGKLLEIYQLLNGSCEDLTDEESLRKDALEEDAAASEAPAASEASAVHEAPAARQYTEEELVKMSRHRRAIYREIRQSEGEYVQALKMMLNTYKKPLLQKKIITDEECRIMFSNVEGLLSTSELLMQLLSGMDKEGAHLCKVLVDAFKMIIPTFKGYSVYCKDYAVATEMLNDKMKNVSVFKKHVVSEQQKTKKDGQLILLQDLIIKPVQRICKYPLFFKAILDKTEDSHPMKKEFQALLIQVQQIANLVDARVKEYGERSKVVSVFNSVEGARDDLLASSRRFLEELQIEFGPLFGSSVKYFKSKLFVFTDRLMIAKITSKKFFSKTMSLKYKHHFDMVDIKLSESRGNPLELDLTSVKTEEDTVTVTKFRCRFGTVDDKDRIKALIDAQRVEAFATSDDLQERRSKSKKTRTWQLRKRGTDSQVDLDCIRERYSTLTVEDEVCRQETSKKLF